MDVHEWQARCACGNRFRVETDSADDEPEQIECTACGADVVDLSHIGRIVR